MFKSYINREERTEADKKLPKLMVEGLLLGGSGLGILALIFEIAADAFSVAAYQTLLAIHGANGHHDIAIMAFTALSILLFLGIVPAYKAGAYLRPNAGGSGPLVEAVGPPRLGVLSWVGTSLFFIDAILTIIISSISAADVTMLFLPQLADFRILLAEFYAFFIMAVLVAVGPKRAVPLFLLGGGAFTLFTIGALTLVGITATANPEWAVLTDGIVRRLEISGVAEHVVQVTQDLPALGSVLFFQLFFRSMSSAMLGFSGYEVIPASGKHAARPKWKVINTALILAAIFLISTGVVQLYAARQWNIPATEGYSTLLIEYEIVAAQMFGRGVNPDAIVVTEADRRAARQLYEEQLAQEQETGEGTSTEGNGQPPPGVIDDLASEIAFSRTITQALQGTSGQGILTVAGVLLAIILLLAQGGGYVGGAAVAANAARLGRLPRLFNDDRMGILVIWGISAIMIPVIREVVVVEAYYAFGFVSAFIITSTTVFFVRDNALRDRGIEPGSAEAKSLRFAGLRGMIASYIMGIVLVTQKTEALITIAIAGAVITIYQIWIAHNGFKAVSVEEVKQISFVPGEVLNYKCGLHRAHDEARQRGIADLFLDLILDAKMVKFNVEPYRIRRLVSYLHNVSAEQFDHDHDHKHSEHVPEPSVALEATYREAYSRHQELLAEIEHFSHYGIFTFIDKYHHNWINEGHGRDAAAVQKAMLYVLFPLTDQNLIWHEYQNYKWDKLPEEIWQFSRKRYQWAKDQWPNLSDKITTIWTLQELGLVSNEVDIKMIISVNAANELREVDLHIAKDEHEELAVHKAGPVSPKPAEPGILITPPDDTADDD